MWKPLSFGPRQVDLENETETPETNEDQSKYKQNEEKEASKEVEEIQTILLEKRLLKTLNRAYIGELSKYGLAASTALYLGLSFGSGHLINLKILTAGFILPGAVLSGVTHYGRHYRIKHIESKLIETYQKEHAQYTRFFRDDDYELD